MAFQKQSQHLPSLLPHLQRNSPWVPSSPGPTCRTWCPERGSAFVPGLQC